MTKDEIRTRHQAAYRRLSDTINSSFPPGRFVAISEDRILADADTFQGLKSLLRDSGNDSSDVLVVQAGVHYPEHVFIFFPGVHQ